MPADTDIGNMALSRLGTRATIADLTENSTEARQINLWYATVRDELQSLVRLELQPCDPGARHFRHSAGALGRQLRLSVGLPAHAAAGARRLDLDLGRAGPRLRDRLERERHLPLLQRRQGDRSVRSAGDRSCPLHTGLRSRLRRLPRSSDSHTPLPRKATWPSGWRGGPRIASNARSPTAPTRACAEATRSVWRKASRCAASTGARHDRPVLLPSFAAGELAPALQGRVDLAKYQVGLATCLNWFVHPFGGVSTRAGTAFVGEVCDSSVRSRLIRSASTRNRPMCWSSATARCVSSRRAVTCSRPAWPSPGSRAPVRAS